MRVIAVVMGTPTPKVRNQHISQLFDYAFSQYDTHPIYKEGDYLQHVKVDKGAETDLQMIVPRQISILTKKGEAIDSYEPYVQTPSYLPAPIKKGDIIGQVKIIKDEQIKAEVDITATDDIPRASFWTLLKRTTAKLFGIQS